MGTLYEVKNGPAIGSVEHSPAVEGGCPVDRVELGDDGTGHYTATVYRHQRGRVGLAVSRTRPKQDGSGWHCVTIMLGNEQVRALIAAIGPEVDPDDAALRAEAV